MVAFRVSLFSLAPSDCGDQNLIHGFDLPPVLAPVQFHQYQVVGRALPTPGDEHPKIYRMKLWATNEVRAKSKFW
jgi:hypothetical protein